MWGEFVKRRGVFWAALVVAILGVAACLAWANWHQGQPLAPGIRADLVVVHKQQRKLHLYKGHQLLKTYDIALGGDPLGPKRQEGDQKTPEGEYVISHKHRSSNFYRSLHVSYPAAKDRAHAKAHGIKRPGGDIKVHGLHRALSWVGSLHTLMDWTAGCIAVTDWEVDELWRAIPNGTRIRILP